MTYITTYSAALCLSVILFADAMAQDMPLDQVLIPGQGWELVSEGHQFTEGPATDPLGQVYFTDVPGNTIFLVDLQGEVTVFDDQAERTSGLYFGPGAELYACQNGGKKIVVYRRDDQGTLSNQPEILAENVTVNDLVVDRFGGVYFTDPRNTRVQYVHPQRLAAVKIQTVASDLNPNGIILWGKGGTLVVTERDEPWLWTFRVEQDGQLSSRAAYYGVVQIPHGQEQPKSDGMVIDDDGRLYLASAVGLQVFDPTGRFSGVIEKPQQAFLSNVIFGGPKFDTLYVTCQDKVFRRKVKVTGRPDLLPSK